MVPAGRWLSRLVGQPTARLVGQSTCTLLLLHAARVLGLRRSRPTCPYDRCSWPGRRRGGWMTALVRTQSDQVRAPQVDRVCTIVRFPTPHAMRKQNTQDARPRHTQNTLHTREYTRNTTQHTTECMRITQHSTQQRAYESVRTTQHTTECIRIRTHNTAHNRVHTNPSTQPVHTPQQLYTTLHGPHNFSHFEEMAPTEKALWEGGEKRVGKDGRDGKRGEQGGMARR